MAGPRSAEDGSRWRSAPSAPPYRRKPPPRSHPPPPALPPRAETPPASPKRFTERRGSQARLCPHLRTYPKTSRVEVSRRVTPRLRPRCCATPTSDLGPSPASGGPRPLFDGWARCSHLRAGAGGDPPERLTVVLG